MLIAFYRLKSYLRTFCYTFEANQKNKIISVYGGGDIFVNVGLNNIENELTFPKASWALLLFSLVSEKTKEHQQ